MAKLGGTTAGRRGRYLMRKLSVARVSFTALLRLLVAGSGPPICAPQHDLNDRIVGQADLDFRPEADYRWHCALHSRLSITKSG